MAIIQIQSKSKKFTELLEQNKLRFYKTAKIILKNDDDICDVLQEALISMYQSYDTLKDKNLFSTWGTRDDYSVKEISKILDISEGTVKSRLSKAREILKEKLEKEEI